MANAITRVDVVDTGVCRMATFVDPDGNPMVLHNRYAPYSAS